MSKIAKAAIGLMIANLLAKIIGFGRELALASAYGASIYSDAYLVALNIPTVIFAAIGQSLSTTFIPLYHNIESANSEDDALKFTNNILHIVTMICIILSILFMIFTKDIVKIFAIGFKDETLKITIDFTRILIMGILFASLSNLITSYLQIKNNFTIPGLASIPKNIIIIISIILSTKYGVYVMLWGTLIGMFMEFLFQIPFAYKKNYRYKLKVNINDKYIREMIILLMPVFIGIIVNQLNTMIDRSLASTLVEGSISALNYANKLIGFVMGLFILSITTVIYPTLSKLSADNNKEDFNKSVVTSINSVVLLITPVTVGAIVLAKPVVTILFQRGEFNERATIMTAIALIFYSIGLIGYALRDILNRIFYSIQDTKTPMINGIISIIFNIILNFIFIKFMGHAGLALATSMSALICIILLFKSLSNKIGDFGKSKIIKTIHKSLLSSAIMGILVYLIYTYAISTLEVSYITHIIATFLSILIGVLAYAAIITILKVDEAKIIIDIIKSKNKLKKGMYI